MSAVIAQPGLWLPPKPHIWRPDRQRVGAWWRDWISPLVVGYSRKFGGTGISSFARTDFAVQTSVTAAMTGLSIGAAPTGGQTRTVIAFVSALLNGTGRTLSSCSIGGVSATIDAQTTYNEAGSYSVVSAWVRAEVPTGTTADVTPVWSTTSGYNSGCVLYRAIKAGSLSFGASGPDNTPSSGVLDLSVNTTASGLVVAGTMQHNGGTVTFTGVTKDNDWDQNSTEYMSTGYSYPASAATPLGITATSSDSTPSGMSGLSVAYS